MLTDVSCAFSYDASVVVGVVNKLDHRRVLFSSQSTCAAKFSRSKAWEEKVSKER